MRGFGMLGVVVVIALGLGPVQAQQLAKRNLVVQGKGIVATEPDMAVISVGVSRSGKTAAAALRANSVDMAAVIAVLKTANIAPRDYQTAGLSLRPRRQLRSSTEKKPKIIGYEAVNTLTIRARDLDGLGRLLDLLTKAGANEIQSIRFDIQEPRPLQDKARQLAISDARAKAELFAQAAGVSLGQVFRIRENNRNSRSNVSFSRAAVDANAVPIAGGEIAISAQVEVIYLLE